MQKPSPERVLTGERPISSTPHRYGNTTIANHLLLLLHADECRRRINSGKQIQCSSKQCQTFRDVLTHMSTCVLGKDCQTPHCAASKLIINHYRQCRNKECKVCEPFRFKMQYVNQNHTGSNSIRNQNNYINGVNHENEKDLSLNGSQNSATSCSSTSNRVNDWRSQLPAKKREMAMRVFVASVFHTDDSKAYNDPRIKCLKEYVQNIELEVYRNAQSLDDYVRDMARRCEHMRNELNKKVITAESTSGSSDSTVQPNTSSESASEQLVEKFEKSVDINLCKIKTEAVQPTMNGQCVEEKVEIKSEPIVEKCQDVIKKSEPLEKNGSPAEQFVKSEPTYENENTVSPVKQSTDTKRVFTEEKPFASKSSDPTRVKKWTQTELQENFLPVLDKLCKEKDAEPFLIPVDWKTLEIPNYPRIVTNPMDLSTIKDNLINEKYTNPWMVVDDFWLMFNNAWLFNKKNSKVYKNCNKLSEVFESLIDPVMKFLGFCCGREYQFLPQLQNCCTVNMCRINRDAVYYQYKNEDKQKTGLLLDKYQVCERCYNDSQDSVGITDDTTVINIPKTELEKFKNNIKELEWFINCRECGRKWHKICACHMDEVWSYGFVCPNCTKSYVYKRKENMYTARRLRSCKLSTFLENRVNSYLKRNCIDTGEVIIRVLASADKAVEVKPGMRGRYCETGEMSESWPYRIKAIFAFQVIDGQEVCFFGLHVQEYGSDSPPPNTRRVYVAYLDSVYFFQPKHCRTDIYHEILVGYMDYAKRLGYTMAHIWACPPSEGDDYIFHMHPPDQKIPKPKRLQEWYQKMLQKALNEHIVYNYKDIHTDAMEVVMMSPTELPYFEGDYWPNQLEEIFKELDDEESKRKKEQVLNKDDEDTADDNDCDSNSNTADQPVTSNNSNPASNSSNKKQKAKKRKLKKANSSGPAGKRKRLTGSMASDMASEVWKKVYDSMDKHKDNFFVIRLIAPSQAATLAPIKDPDPLIPSDLMECRDNFLNSARDKHLEFSTLRRAKYSTLHMLYDIHTEGRQPMIYTCNVCSCQLDIRWHCNVCLEYDLCMKCYETEKHPHTMVKTGSDDDNGGVDDKGDVTVQESQRDKLERAVKAFEHSWACRDVNCRNSQCAIIKKMIAHCRYHKSSCENGKCTACHKVKILCLYHAKICHDAKCTIFYCTLLKNKRRQDQMQQRMQQAKLLRRRMAAMQRSTPSQKSNGSGSSNNFQQPSGGNVNNPNSALGESPASNSAHTPGGGSQLQTSQPTTPYGGNTSANPIQSPQLPSKMPHNSPSQAAPSPYHYNQTLSPYQQIQSSQPIAPNIQMNQQCPPSSSGAPFVQQHPNVVYHNPAAGNQMGKPSGCGPNSNITHPMSCQSVNTNFVGMRPAHSITKNSSMPQTSFTSGNVPNQPHNPSYRQQAPRYPAPQQAQQQSINYQHQQMQLPVDQNIQPNQNLHRSMSASNTLSVPNVSNNNIAPPGQMNQLPPNRSFCQIPQQSQQNMIKQQQQQQPNIANWSNQSQGTVISHGQLSQSSQHLQSQPQQNQINMMFANNNIASNSMSNLHLSMNSSQGSQVKQMQNSSNVQSTISSEDIRIVQQHYAHFRSQNGQNNEFHQWLSSNPNYMRAWQFIQQHHQHQQQNSQFHQVPSNGSIPHHQIMNGLPQSSNQNNLGTMTLSSQNVNNLNPSLGPVYTNNRMSSSNVMSSHHQQWAQSQDRLRNSQILQHQQQHVNQTKIPNQNTIVGGGISQGISPGAGPNRFSQMGQAGNRMVNYSNPGKPMRLPNDHPSSLQPQNTALSQLLSPSQHIIPPGHQQTAPAGNQMLNQPQHSAYQITQQQHQGGNY